MNTVKIDPDKLDEFLTKEGLTTQELSSELGFEKDYIKAVLNGEPMALPVWKLFQVLYALDDDEFSPDPDNAQRLSLSLNATSDRVRIGLLENGVETDYAFSKIRGEREVDLIQAISYATHILYKNAEQRDLGGGSKRMMCPFRPTFSLNPVTGNCPPPCNLWRLLMRVLVACEESQEVCKAFRLRGHEAYSCDLQEPSGGHPEWHILGDALKAIGGGSNHHGRTYTRSW